MGLDTLIVAPGNFTDEFIQELTNQCSRRELYSGGPYTYPPIHKCENGLWWSNGERYYDIDYTRGRWPMIYAAIRLIENRTGTPVLYADTEWTPDRLIQWGRDDPNAIEWATPARCAMLWDTWCSSEGDSYLRHAEEWNARNQERT